MTRDSQRQKVYDAEWDLRHILDHATEIGNPTVELKGMSLTLPPEARFANLESMQEYVDRVVKRMDAELPDGVAALHVRERRGDRYAHYEKAGKEGPTIAIPMNLGSFALRETIVLHEIAHHLAPGHMHGPVYASAYIALLGTIMAPEMALAQRIIYDLNGVKVG